MQSEQKKESTIKVGSLVLDLEKYEVHIDGKVINLTLREFEVLKYLAKSLTLIENFVTNLSNNFVVFSIITLDDDVKCSKSLSDEIERLGAKGLCYRTGNSYTKAKVREEDLPFGGELSGHVYFRDKFPGFDSGLYAGLRLYELLSNTNLKCSELLNGYEKYYNYAAMGISDSNLDLDKYIQNITHKQQQKMMESLFCYSQILKNGKMLGCVLDKIKNN